MSYVIKAVLSSAARPELGQATIPFPIPEQEYGQALELLACLEIGNALEQDCRIEELDSWYGVLGTLEGTEANVDELEYLAKRLDSFDKGETAQFQAMAHKLRLKDIKDFINLTFCCRQATVITNFSDLEAVGHSHFMNLHDGSAKPEELENLDGTETAWLLIDGGCEAVTPYGVVYDNGMKLEQLYDGRHFPAHLCDVHPLILSVSSKQKPGDKPDYLYLPTAPQKVEWALRRAGVTNKADLRLQLEFYELPEQIAFAADLDHLERADLSEWNRMCQAVKALSTPEQKKLEAAAILSMPHGPDEVYRLAENLDQFDFVPAIRTPEEYGRYLIRESGRFKYDENLEGFYDFQGYGLQQMEKEPGQFNSMGYIAYHGTLMLDELLREDPAEQYQREQGQLMG